jgi:hypothetical protein
MKTSVFTRDTDAFIARRTVRAALLVAAALVLATADCGGESRDRRAGATVAITVRAATAGRGMQFQFPRPGGYVIDGTATPLLAPAADPAVEPQVTGLDVELMAFDEQGALVAVADVAMAAPAGSRPDDIWTGSTPVTAREDVRTRATLVLTRPGETPPTHVDTGVVLAFAPDIVDAWIAPSPVAPGAELTAYVQATDRDGPPDALTVTAGFGAQAVPLRLVSSDGTTGTWMGPVTAPLAEGEYFITLTARDADGAETTDYKFELVAENGVFDDSTSSEIAYDWGWTWLSEFTAVSPSRSGRLAGAIHKFTIRQDADGVVTVSVTSALLGTQTIERGMIILKVYDDATGALLFEEEIDLDWNGDGMVEHDLGYPLPPRVKVGISFVVREVP